MLAIERRNEIIALLEKNQSVLVSELSKLYDVTEETIRRDLEKLEKEGLVKKTYGGAVLKENINIDMPLRVRERSNKEEKSIIAMKVCEAIEDGDTIMLDSSSTALTIAKHLRNKKKLTVITNSVEILVALSDVKDINVISTGGTLRESSLSLVGRNAERMLSNFNVDITIISCKGVHMDKGVTESNEMEVDIKKAMIHSAKKVILAVDSSKFNRVSFTKLMELKDFDILATEKMEDELWIEALRANNVEVL